jgi:hypothetical protein
MKTLRLHSYCLASVVEKVKQINRKEKRSLEIIYENDQQDVTV